ncbi:MAG: 6-phosphofructokinase [Armatimonadota bacterium]|nr:6-phosphofructokinase [Armatimonadota bacterium]
MPLTGNAIIGQSGGPTIVINASLVGAIQAAWDLDEIEHFYGALHGMDGVLNEDLCDLFREDPDLVEEMRLVPSAGLGTCRLKPTDEDLERAMEVFKAHNVRYFFYTGGDDSQLCCHNVSELAKSSDWDMHIIGIPKTIDNNLVVTDTCPGFGSAARYAATCCQYVGRDAEAFGTLEVVEVMGRHEGWLTGATAAARPEPDAPPHLVYLPEVEVTRQQLIDDVQRKYDQYGYCVVAASEGFAFKGEERATTSDKVDEFGHSRLGGVAQWLGEVLEEAIGVRARYDKLGNLQRSFAATTSQVDLDQAYAVGKAAVEWAVEGQTDIMVTIERENDDPYEWEVGATSLMSVAGESKAVPREWINEEGNDITEEFVTYCRPLLRGRACELDPGFTSFPRFHKHTIEKKLEPYERE